MAATSEPEGRPTAVRSTAVRLTFAYDASGIRLIDRTEVHKPAGPADEAPAPGAAASVRAELRTAADRTVFRRELPPEALPTDAEVFDPAAEGGVRRDPTPLPSGVFTVVVPVDDDAEEVVLVADRGLAPDLPAGPSRPGAASAAGPSELGRFPLRER